MHSIHTATPTEFSQSCDPINGEDRDLENRVLARRLRSLIYGSQQNFGKESKKCESKKSFFSHASARFGKNTAKRADPSLLLHSFSFLGTGEREKDGRDSSLDIKRGRVVFVRQTKTTRPATPAPENMAHSTIYLLSSAAHLMSALAGGYFWPYFEAGEGPFPYFFRSSGEGENFGAHFSHGIGS